MRFRCPHCNEFGHVRKTVRNEANPLFASFYVRCSNLYCGHIWRMDTEASYTTKKTQLPGAEPLIPESKHMKKATVVDALPEQTTPDLPGFEHIVES
jgi:hypothetical protein